LQFAIKYLSSGGIGFCGLLTIVFIVLKLIGVISWSWWWVLAPVWIPTALVVALVILVFLVFLIAMLCGYKLTVKKKN
jgi:hypothetical protein